MTQVRRTSPRHGAAVRIAIIIVALVFPATAPGQQIEEKKREPRWVHMPDGQLQSHLVSVYVTERLTDDNKPGLRLSAGHSFADPDIHEGDLLEPTYVVPDQQWLEDRGGETPISKPELCCCST